MAPFREKATGIPFLRGLAANPHVDSYLEKMDDMVPYHSMDAACAYAKFLLGEGVESSNSVGRTCWDRVQAVAAHSRFSSGCLATHFGLCATDDAPLIARARLLGNMLPRHDAVIQFVRSSVVYFFRLVIGKGLVKNRVIMWATKSCCVGLEPAAIGFWWRP